MVAGRVSKASNLDLTPFVFMGKAYSWEKPIHGKSRAERKSEMLDLLLEIQLLSDADAFIGTLSSNIGRLVALFRDGKNCHSLDGEWRPE